MIIHNNIGKDSHKEVVENLRVENWYYTPIIVFNSGKLGDPISQLLPVTSRR